MPWRESEVVEERSRFVVEYESGEWTMAELMPTLRDRAQDRLQDFGAVGAVVGADGLKDLSRMPHRHPNQTPAEIEEQILAVRHAHMRWGPRKLRSWLESRHPGQRLARAQHHRRVDQARRPGQPSAPAPPHAALYAAVCFGRRQPTMSGAWTSRAGFAPATARALIRSL